jgi:hypothetical protein
MAAVLSHGDPVEVGWASAVMTNEMLRTVWAANDLPNPSLDLGTVQRQAGSRWAWPRSAASHADVAGVPHLEVTRGDLLG